MYLVSNFCLKIIFVIYCRLQRDQCWPENLLVQKVLHWAFQASEYLFFMKSLRKPLQRQRQCTKWNPWYSFFCFIPQKKDPNRKVFIHVQSRDSGAEQEQRLPLYPPPNVFREIPNSHLWKSDILYGDREKEWPRDSFWKMRNRNILCLDFK